MASALKRRRADGTPESIWQRLQSYLSPFTLTIWWSLRADIPSSDCSIPESPGRSTGSSGPPRAGLLTFWPFPHQPNWWFRRYPEGQSDTRRLMTLSVSDMLRDGRDLVIVAYFIRCGESRLDVGGKRWCHWVLPRMHHQVTSCTFAVMTHTTS